MIPVIAASCLGLAFAGCDTPWPQDVDRLERVRKIYGGRYDVSLQPPSYVRVQPRGPASDTTPAAIEPIAREWWGAHGEGALTSEYQYINVYDHEGRWQFQAWLDRNTGKLMTQRKQEHY
jgi:hypothetical protein